MSDRFARQILVAEIGAEGQAKIAAATAMVVDRGLAGQVEARLLAGAGFGLLRTASTAIAREAKSVWPSLVTAADAPPVSSPTSPLADSVSALVLDPSARDVALGAARALRQIKAALGLREGVDGGARR